LRGNCPGTTIPYGVRIPFAKKLLVGSNCGRGGKNELYAKWLPIERSCRITSISQFQYQRQQQGLTPRPTPKAPPSSAIEGGFWGTPLALEPSDRLTSANAEKWSVPDSHNAFQVHSLVRIWGTVSMTISGHKTRAVFDRYNIVSESDLIEAARKIEEGREIEVGHSFGQSDEESRENRARNMVQPLV
jgi:hypothetical protein